MRTIQIPTFLHDVFGETQTWIEVVTILVFGIGGSCMIFFQFPEITQNGLSWKVILGFLLIFDILAGCVANFSRGTSEFYASRNKNRIVFLAIHFHILGVAWLLGASIEHSLIIWGYTILSGGIVNYLKGNRFQLFTGGFLMSSGIIMIVSIPAIPLWFLIVSMLYMVKVMFSFAVDHYSNKTLRV